MPLARFKCNTLLSTVLDLKADALGILDIAQFKDLDIEKCFINNQLAELIQCSYHSLENPGSGVKTKLLRS